MKKKKKCISVVLGGGITLKSATKSTIKINPITFSQTNQFHLILNVQLVTEQLLTGKRQRSSTRLTRDEQSDGVKAYHVLTYLISTLESEVEF